MNKKSLIRIVGVVAAVAVVIVVTQIIKAGNKPEELPPPIRPVKTMLVADTPSQFRRVMPGRLEASETVDLSFLTAGDLIELPIKEGDRLVKGDLIAKLDARDAQNRFNAARADFVLAESELDRNKTLFDEELISAAEFEAKKRTFDVTVAAFDTAVKAVEDTEIRAPFDGLVAQRNVDNFQKVQAGQIIVTFFNPSGFDIVVDLPESLVSQIPYYTSEIHAEFQQAPGREFPLDVKEFATVADTYTKSYALTLSMDRPEDVLILPNMTVTVNIDFTRKAVIDDSQYLVPASAIVYNVESDEAVIWVVDESSMTVNPKTVQADRTQGGDVVVEGGLSAGDIIVIAGGTFLNRDQQVRFLEG